MIVRTWHGCVPLEHAESFAKHLEKTGIEHSRSISGNKGAFVRRETQGGWEHFFLATYWQDLITLKLRHSRNHRHHREKQLNNRLRPIFCISGLTVHGK